MALLSQLDTCQTAVATAIRALTLDGFVFDGSTPGVGETPVKVLVERKSSIVQEVETAVAKATQVAVVVEAPTLSPSQSSQTYPLFEAVTGIVIVQNLALDQDDANAETLPGWRVFAVVDAIVAGLYQDDAVTGAFQQWRITSIVPIRDPEVFGYRIELRQGVSFG